ncbi:MAG: GNAT family N-acetyltransferase [Planctomycetota bacterium]|jgi:ribosomal protein S18 acetylase RimI-like enzyme
MTVEYRRLGPHDSDLANAIVTRFKSMRPGSKHAKEWLASDRHLLVAALEGSNPVGWVYGYELPRIDRDEAMFLLYEIDVDEVYRRRGIGAELVRRFRDLAPGPVWLLTNESNEAAMRLYRSAGGERPNDDDAMFRFKSG